MLDVHVPEKKRVVRGNQKSYITKALRKAIMRRYFLKNKTNKTGDVNFINLCKRQRNIVVNMNREAKKSYFHSLGTSKDFSKYSKPYFSNKSLMRESIVLHDDGKNVITDEISIASLLNNYFVNIAKDLNVTPWKSCPDNLETNQSALNDMDQILRVYQDHPSIKAILDAKCGSTFSFPHVTANQVQRAIADVDPRKAVSGPIPTKVLQMVPDLKPRSINSII